MAIINTSKLITIDRYLEAKEHEHPEATGDFTNILHDLVLSFRLISLEIRRAGINDILGLTENTNSAGDKVHKLDEFANDVFFKMMSRSGNLCVMASEESEDVIDIPDNYKKGKYVLIFDPLDGSTNIDAGIAIGSIFSLYKRLDTNSDSNGTIIDVLQPGYKQTAAGYILYGSSTILVYTTGEGVNVFTYDHTIGEFLLTYEKLTIPQRGSMYSCNESHYFEWDDKIRRYLDYIKTPTSDGKHPYITRYVATIVADIHRMLNYGGIYLYPPNTRAANGKIRLLYEANPLAMIIEQAGGKATTGTQRILDMIPESIHQQIPFYAGSVDDVNELEKFLKN